MNIMQTKLEKAESELERLSPKASESGEMTCRYTGDPLSKCRCEEGCEPTKVTGGEWIQPIETGYRIICCDCGLVHLMDFRVHEGHAQFRAFRERPIEPDVAVRIAAQTITLAGHTWQEWHDQIDEMFGVANAGEDIPFSALYGWRGVLTEEDFSWARKMLAELPAPPKASEGGK